MAIIIAPLLSKGNSVSKSVENDKYYNMFTAARAYIYTYMIY